MDATEQRFQDAVEDLLDYRPTQVLPLLASALERRGARILCAAVGIGDYPQVVASITIDDVTEEVAKQVIVRVLDRVGMQKEAAAMMAATAATVVGRWVANQRMRRAAEAGKAPTGGWGKKRG